ncbi:hypothetical protein [Nocardia neocaledoniensis]|uniref:hypothetical protein n=1 Tax=Nocardia neocaledoniensis TaxID=236511 RepID=UPI0024578D18|nr:hypothetical protein [Nocardia neocaledoniensis]
MPDRLAQLTATLGTPPPPEFAALDIDDLARLDTFVESALAARKAAMDEALGAGMHLIPRLARPAVRKVLGL